MNNKNPFFIFTIRDENGIEKECCIKKDSIVAFYPREAPDATRLVMANGGYFDILESYENVKNLFETYSI